MFFNNMPIMGGNGLMTRTERIPRPPMMGGMPQGMPQISQPSMMQGLGSQGIFQNYMKGIFNNPYMPPGMSGGFMPPDMSLFRPKPAQQPVMDPAVSTPGSPAYGMIPQGNGNYQDPRTGNFYRDIDLLNPGA